MPLSANLGTRADSQSVLSLRLQQRWEGPSCALESHWLANVWGVPPEHRTR